MASRIGSRDAVLRARAEAVIPGGMYGHQAVGLLPDDYPQFFSRGQGARLWDADGRALLDFMCAYGPNLFGYGHPEINAAYVRQLGLYRVMVGKLYPGRIVRAALIWTDVPDLMELSAEVLDAAVARLTST